MEKDTVITDLWGDLYVVYGGQMETIWEAFDYWGLVSCDVDNMRAYWPLEIIQKGHPTQDVILMPRSWTLT